MHTQQQRLERTVLCCRLQACQQVKNHITVAVQDTDVRRLKRKPKLKKRERIMVFTSLHTPPRVNSTMVVNHYEKRIEIEVKQLVSDVQRIKPEGELYCLFGDLFTDPQVEQFYEALVGTLKAAKKKGLIQFKGQILLKGMHDQIKVSIVHDHDDDNYNSANVNVDTYGCGIQREAMVMTMDPIKVQLKKNTRKGSSANSEQTTLNDKRRYAVTKNSETQTSGSATKQALLTPTQFKGQKTPRLSASLCTPTPSNYSKHGDDASSHSFATAATPAIRSPILSTMPTNEVSHSSSTGSIFHSNSIAETHEERVHREVHQLVLDVERIQPEGEKYCAFGDLFDDELVEQYYEALVGTLRAAKRKGLIKFKGQMLFKGMHDGVQIDIAN